MTSVHDDAHEHEPSVATSLSALYSLHPSLSLYLSILTMLRSLDDTENGGKDWSSASASHTRLPHEYSRPADFCSIVTTHKNSTVQYSNDSMPQTCHSKAAQTTLTVYATNIRRFQTGLETFIYNRLHA